MLFEIVPILPLGSDWCRSWPRDCRSEVVSRGNCITKSQRKAVKDTRERWFGAETVASSAVGEATPRTNVRISDVAGVGDVQYVEEHIKLDFTCFNRSSPGERKKTRMPVSRVVARKQYSVESPSASPPFFETALEKNFEKSGARWSGADRHFAPVFHGGYQ